MRSDHDERVNTNLGGMICLAQGLWGKMSTVAFSVCQVTCGQTYSERWENRRARVWLHWSIINDYRRSRTVWIPITSSILALELHSIWADCNTLKKLFMLMFSEMGGVSDRHRCLQQWSGWYSQISYYQGKNHYVLIMVNSEFFDRQNCNK